jgi:hypothetical protein
VRRAIKLFGFFALASFGIGSLAYLALVSILPQERVFGALPRMFLYHHARPFEYIAVVALTYAAIATSGVIFWPRPANWRRKLAIIAIMLLSIFSASIPGGILWKLHDMQAGFFPKGTQFWQDLLWGATAGLENGWLIVTLSIPYNLLVAIPIYWLTLRGFKFAASLDSSITSTPPSQFAAPRQ